MVCWKARRRGNGLDQISGISENRGVRQLYGGRPAVSFTQSGVSHAISGLEEELGVTLLSRSRGGVTLTADGWALMPYIQEICRQQRSIEERAKDLQGLETGVVRVAVFTSVSVQWMPYILKSFREQYPNIEFELLPSNYNTEIARWIQDGTADCGFLVLPTEANLDCWLLQRDQWKAIVPWDHPLAGREPFPPEALAQYPFILLEEGDDYEIQEVLDTLGVQPNVQYRVQQDQVILAMVSCGLGISIMEELMLDRNEYPVVACSFAKPFYRNIGICVKDKRAISRSTYRFVEHVRRWVLEKYSG